MKDPSKALVIFLFFWTAFFICACGKEPPTRVVRLSDVTVVLPVQGEVPKYLDKHRHHCGAANRRHKGQGGRFFAEDVF